MPGLDAISAALYPEPGCGYLYFCATGDGGTVYAVTEAEHQANVAQYQDAWAQIDAGVVETETSSEEQEETPVEG